MKKILKQDFKDLSSSRSLFKKGVGGGGRSLLSLSSFGLGAVKTPKSTAVTGIAVYTGVKALKLIPPALVLVQQEDWVLMEHINSYHLLQQWMRQVQD